MTAAESVRCNAKGAGGDVYIVFRHGALFTGITQSGGLISLLSSYLLPLSSHVLQIASQFLRNLLHLKNLYDVALLNVGEIGEAYAALHPALRFLHGVLEAPDR